MDGYPNIIDGTECIRRHTETRTTHVHKLLRGYYNNGPKPYKGITKGYLSYKFWYGKRKKVVILVDDIYTPKVNIDED